MLTSLLGNRTVEKILLFLLVNGKGYGTEFHRKLKIPLTPVQNALARLESGEVISSYYEGKTRMYQFNPIFPLLEELEQLLKKAYTLLPPEEKKLYYALAQEPMATKQLLKPKVLKSLWEKLETVNRFTLNATSKSQVGKKSGWNRVGRGVVEVVKSCSHSLIFREKGQWQQNEEKEMQFSNVYRWTLDRDKRLVSLEHLRRGVDHPVFLFHLEPSGNHALSSVDSHFCEGDIYFGKVMFDHSKLRLSWRVIGPRKNEELDCCYT